MDPVVDGLPALTRPDPAADWVPGEEAGMGRGRLRVYLGAAPGVGTTYAMLAEGQRRAARGTDVVVGAVETHGRPRTDELLAGLELVPLGPGGALDVRRLLQRSAAVVLVDDLATADRWRDVDRLLTAGADVVATVDVSELDSLHDVVADLTGRAAPARLPDAVLRGADEVELVDMAPEALRRRLAHGNVVPADRVDAELASYFRPGNLAALRQLALLWTADRVATALASSAATREGIRRWEARERVVVALTGGAEGETLLRRGAGIAARSAGGDLLAVHVARSDELSGASPAALEEQRELVESLGGSYHVLAGDDVASTLLAFAEAERATQLVIGGSRRSRWGALLSGGGTTTRVLRASGDIDVHVVPHAQVGRGRRLPPVGGGVTRRRRIQGAVVAAVGLPALTAVLSRQQGGPNLATDALLFLLLVVVASLVGGFAPGIGAALAAYLLLNYYFTPPLHTFDVHGTTNGLTLVVFVLVAAAVSWVVDVAARRAREAARASAEAAVLGALAGTVLRGETALGTLLDRVREAFGVAAVGLLEPAADGAGWRPVAVTGADAPTTPDAADTVVPAGADLRLVLRGRPVRPGDQRLLGAFAAQAAVVVQRSRLATAAAAAGSLAEVDRMRTALLAAVGHDLRTPLAAAKAAVTGLRSPGVDWSDADRAELLRGADESLDRLARLVDDLLDMSRLHAGALSVALRPIGLDELVPQALDEVDPAGELVDLAVPDDLPAVRADPGLLVRVVVNLLANALRHSPAGSRPLVTASAFGDRVELRVVDRGPGIPASLRESVFAPFQRLGDADNASGVGLGLALSRGLTEAMGGRLLPEETPGGGLTMVVSLEADVAPPVAPGRREREGGGT